MLGQSFEFKNPFVKCDHCKRQTYDRSELPEGRPFKLPKGLDRGQGRYTVTVEGETKTFCEKCRFDIYGKY